MLYLLPHIFTSLNLFCGFYAIISVINGAYVKAAWLIFLAIFFDIFDGRIARLTRNTSPFGLEYDSLSDLVSFGVAPAILSYKVMLHQFVRVGWLACFLFVACVALRLARFNIKPSFMHTFEGLPSPAAGAFIASLVLLSESNISMFQNKWIFLVVVYLLSYLLVSSIPYPSFKSLRLEKGQFFYFLVGFIVFLTIFALKPTLFFFVLLSFYIFFAPLALFLKGLLLEKERILKKIDKTKKMY